VLYIVLWIVCTGGWLFLLQHRLPRTSQWVIFAAVLGLVTTVLLGLVLLALFAGRTND